jgi:hypothetical protein
VRRGRVTSALLAGASLWLVISCGGDADVREAPELRVDLIEAALDAVENETGEGTTYFEVNATSLVVNVFVAVEGTSVVQYIFDGESLNGPTAPVAAEGTTFVRGVVDVEVDRVLDDVIAELPDSEPQMFVITGAGTGGAALRTEYRVLMRSVKGGELAVMVDGDGTIIGTDAE